jgi:hypothetical protein
VTQSGFSARYKLIVFRSTPAQRSHHLLYKSEQNGLAEEAEVLEEEDQKRRSNPSHVCGPG